MVGAVLGDIIGSRHEFHNVKTKQFELFTPECTFTDDTVMTLAVAAALMECDGRYEELSDKTIRKMQEIGRKYPNCGFGGLFYHWIFSDNPKPYHSFGNGAAMRVSPVGFISKSVEEAKDLSYRVTAVSHDHPEGLKGAEAVAVSIVMARQGRSKEEIKAVMEKDYYVSAHNVAEYRDLIRGHGDETCQVAMPEALQCFYEGTSYEDVIRNCISIGGDSDTLAAIAGGIAEAYFGVPEALLRKAADYLDEELMSIFVSFLPKGSRVLWE